MATTRATATTPRQRTNPMEVFVWQGVDKRGTKMKGEISAKSQSIVQGAA